MLLKFFAASATVVLCACFEPDKSVDNALKPFIGLFFESEAKSIGVSQTLIHDIGLHAVRCVRELNSMKSEEVVQDELLASNQMTANVYGYIAWAIFNLYESRLVELARCLRENEKKTDDLESDIRILKDMLKHFVTPNSLYVKSGNRTYFWLDILDKFKNQVSEDVIVHILDVLDAAPAHSVKSTGMFASNMLQWSFQQRFYKEPIRDKHYYFLQRMQAHDLITQQTVINTINFLQQCQVPKTSAVYDTLTWMFNALNDNIPAVRLIVPAYGWLTNNEKVKARLFPSPGTPEYHERQRVQSGLMALMKGATGLFPPGQEVFLLKYLFFTGWSSINEDPSPHIGSAIHALLNVGHHGATTVATSIIRYLSTIINCYYAAEILRQVVEHGQEVDEDIKLDGFTVQEHIVKIVKRGIVLPPDQKGNAVLIAMIDAAESQKFNFDSFNSQLAIIKAMLNSSFDA